MEKDYFDQIKSYKGSFVSYLILKEAIDVRRCASCGRCQKAVNDTENRN